MNAAELVLRFADAVNLADVDRLSSLMTEGHVFIDSDGSRIIGRSAASKAWSQYFAMMHDYTVQVQETFLSGGTVVLVGMASGTYAGGGTPRASNRWTVPAA